MTATVYRDALFQGPFAQIRPGFFSGRDLRGFRNQAPYDSGEDLDNAISSVRVGPNTIVALYGGQAPSAAAGARVLVGPTDVPDLGALGFDEEVSAVQVLAFRRYDSAVPRGGGVVAYGGYEGGGRSATLERGDFDAARLASEEVRLLGGGGQLRSLRVSANVIAILYSGPDFDPDRDAVVVVGPTMIGDLDRVGLLDRVASIRVLYTDPHDVPGRPSSWGGASRASFPGGGLPLGMAAPPAAPARLPPPPPPPPAGPAVVPPAAGGEKRRGGARNLKMWVLFIILVIVVTVLGTVAARVWKAPEGRPSFPIDRGA